MTLITEPQSISTRRFTVEIAFWAILLAVALAAALAAPQKTATRPSARYAVEEEKVKQLVLLMDKDRDGKVSKDEFMKFMETELDLLDRR
jgi:hypothetical protein